MVEQLTFNQLVRGSSPRRATRQNQSHTRHMNVRRGFFSLEPSAPLCTHHFLAVWPDSSMVEQLTLNQLVRGSSPRPATSGILYRLPRWRSTSKRQTPAATETFRQGTVPSIGMLTKRSQVSAVRWRMPSPSAPNTIAKGPVSFAL